MRRIAFLAALLLPACTTTPPPQAAMTHGTVPRNGRGEPVLAAVLPPPPPSPPPPAEFKPVTEQTAAQKPVDCSHLRHC